MGLAALLQTPDLNEEHESLKSAFLELTGYGSHDLLSLNYDTHTFLTVNGGLYRVNDDGTVEHLDGPPPDVEDRFEL